MFRFIALHCGYVESCRTSLMVFQCQFFGHAGYVTRQEAISQLALDMYAKYHDEILSIYNRRYNDEVKECCRNSLIKDRTVKQCFTCQGEIADKPFDYQEFMEYVDGLHSTTSDDYGEAESTGTHHFAWWPFWTNDFIGAPKEDIIYIGDSAEVVLLSALLEAKPELHDAEADRDRVEDTAWQQFKQGIQPSYV